MFDYDVDFQLMALDLDDDRTAAAQNPLEQLPEKPDFTGLDEKVTIYSGTTFITGVNDEVWVTNPVDTTNEVDIVNSNGTVVGGTGVNRGLADDNSDGIPDLWECARVRDRETGEDVGVVGECLTS